jgi:hypothetical protein
MDEYILVGPVRIFGFAILVVGLMAAYELGYRWARQVGEHITSAQESHIAVVLGAVLGLMAFLLGFTFNIAEAQFEQRRQLVLQEANAIGTAFLRARYLPSPEAGRVQGMLREYVALRVADQDMDERDKMEAGLRRTSELQAALWEQAVAVERGQPESVGMGLFVASLNEVIDLHTSRVTTVFHYRLPLVMVVTVFLVSLLAIGFAGYGAGLVGRRTLVAPLVLVLGVSLIFTLILELDRPSQRLFRVSQQALIDTQDMIESYR